MSVGSTGPAAGSSGPRVITEHYTVVEADTELWHVYPTARAAREFNPVTRNRFAIPPPPTRGMYYAGESSACALWEAVLRNLVVEAGKKQSVDPDMLEGRSITRIKLTQDVPVLDLRAPHLRALSADKKLHALWQRLAVAHEDDYDQTHAEARALVAAAPKAAGLRWHSRQISTQTAYVFYAPPLAPPLEFEVLEEFELKQRKGWVLIDQALALVKMKRIGADELAQELLDELPPIDLEGG